MSNGAFPSPENCLAVIPARGGSKRIPRKNIRMFHGLPLMVRPIQTALQSGLFRDVVVTTDDDEIAHIARTAGALVPFTREATLSDDFTPLRLVIADAIERYRTLTEVSITYICLIYPAAVFMLVEDLKGAMNLMGSTDVDHIVSASAHPSPVQRAWEIGEQGLASMIWPEHRYTRTQDLPQSFYDCGQFALARTTYWLAADPASYRTALYCIPRLRAIDIDTEADWTAAERLYHLYL